MTSINSKYFRKDSKRGVVQYRHIQHKYRTKASAWFIRVFTIELLKLLLIYNYLNNSVICCEYRFLKH